MVRVVGLLALALTSPLALADVATDHRGAVYLYYATGSTLVRMACDADAVLHDRTTCTTGRETTPFAPVEAAVAALAGQDIAALQARMDQYFVKITQLDGMLLEIVSSDPDASAGLPALQAKIEALEDKIATERVLEHDLKEQVIRIEEELQTSDDEDLLLQLRETRARLTSTQEKILRLRDQLAALREDFLSHQTSLLDDETFQSLSDQREAAAGQLAETRRRFDAEWAEVGHVRQLFKMVLQQVHAYEILSDQVGFEELKPFARELFGATQKALIAATAQTITDTQRAADGYSASIRSLELEHAPGVAVVDATVKGARSNLVETVYVYYAPSNGDANACANHTLPGGAIGDQPISIWNGTGAAGGDEALIDSLDDRLFTGDLATGVLRTEIECKHFFQNDLPWAYQLSAALALRERLGGNYCVDGESGAGTVCGPLVRLHSAWSVYQERGGHEWAARTRASHAANLAKAAQIRDGDLAPALSRLAMLRTRLAALQAAQ